MALPSPQQLGPVSTIAGDAAETSAATIVAIPAFLDPECFGGSGGSESHPLVSHVDSGAHSAPLTPPLSQCGTPAGTGALVAALTSGTLAAHRRKQPVTPGAVLRALPAVRRPSVTTTAHTTPQHHAAASVASTAAADEAPMRALMMSSIGSWPGCSLVDVDEPSDHEPAAPPSAGFLLPQPVIDASDDGAPLPRPVAPSEQLVSPPVGAWCRDGHPLEDLFA